VSKKKDYPFHLGQRVRFKRQVLFVYLGLTRQVLRVAVKGTGVIIGLRYKRLGTRDWISQERSWRFVCRKVIKVWLIARSIHLNPTYVEEEELEVMT
jgi:hypothetical protein